MAHLIKSGHVEAFKCGTLKAAEGVLRGIRSRTIQCDVFSLDTITALTERLKLNLVFGKVSSAEGNWDTKKEISDTYDTYRAMGNWTNYITGLMRTVTEETGIPHIIVAHERSRVDPISGVEKTISNLQRNINTNLYSFADSIIRLTFAPVPLIYQGVTWPRGTRILITSATEDPTGQSSTGTRVSPDVELPPFMVVPDIRQDPYGFARFVQAAGRLPLETLLYGPPKIGKTTFISGVVYL